MPFTGQSIHEVTAEKRNTMTSHTYSNDDEDEDVAPALRLSQVSPDDPDEQAARLPSQGSALANITPNPRSNEQDDLTLPLGALSLPSDALNEQITKFHSEGLVPSAGGGASPRHGDNHELAQHLPQQLVGIVEVEVRVIPSGVLGSSLMIRG